MKKNLRRELLDLMRQYHLNSAEVAQICYVVPTTVRKWRCSVRPVPPYALALLKLTEGDVTKLPT